MFAIQILMALFAVIIAPVVMRGLHYVPFPLIGNWFEDGLGYGPYALAFYMTPLWIITVVVAYKMLMRFQLGRS